MILPLCAGEIRNHKCKKQSVAIDKVLSIVSPINSISVVGTVLFPFFLSAFIVAVVFNGYIQEMIFGYTYFVARNFASKNSSGSILVELSFSNMKMYTECILTIFRTLIPFFLFANVTNWSFGYFAQQIFKKNRPKHFQWYLASSSSSSS